MLWNLRRGAEVKLAKLRGDVTDLLQPRSDCRFLVESIERRTVVLESKASLKSTGEQSAARGYTLWRGAITVLRQHPATSERVNMRRLHVLLHTLDSEIGVAMVIGKDEDDVGPRQVCRESRFANDAQRRRDESQKFHRFIHSYFGIAFLPLSRGLPMVGSLPGGTSFGWGTPVVLRPSRLYLSSKAFNSSTNSGRSAYWL